MCPVSDVLFSTIRNNIPKALPESLKDLQMQNWLAVLIEISKEEMSNPKTVSSLCAIASIPRRTLIASAILSSRSVTEDCWWELKSHIPRKGCDGPVCFVEVKLVYILAFRCRRRIRESFEASTSF
jgi:hypothetical protein